MSELSEYQQARIEKNRQRALLLRASRVAAHPYADERTTKQPAGRATKAIDSGGGFLIDPEDVEEETVTEVEDSS